MCTHVGAGIALDGVDPPREAHREEIKDLVGAVKLVEGGDRYPGLLRKRDTDCLPLVYSTSRKASLLVTLKSI